MDAWKWSAARPHPPLRRIRRGCPGPGLTPLSLATVLTLLAVLAAMIMVPAPARAEPLAPPTGPGSPVSPTGPAPPAPTTSAPDRPATSAPDRPATSAPDRPATSAPDRPATAHSATPPAAPATGPPQSPSGAGTPPGTTLPAPTGAPAPPTATPAPARPPDPDRTSEPGRTSEPPGPPEPTGGTGSTPADPGPATDQTRAPRPVTPPAPPAGVTGVPRATAIDVSWQPAARLGSGTLTGYTATARPGLASCSTTAGLPTPPLAPGPASGRPPPAGPGPDPAGTPLAPAGPTTGPAPGTGAPDRGAGASASASLRPGGAGGPTGAPEAGPGAAGPAATACAITGLVNGTRYTITVVTHTTDGDSPPSDPTDQLTPYLPPGPPTSVTATAGDASVDVSWRAPRRIGTGPITGYTATAEPGLLFCAVSPTRGGARCTITGLANGTAYTVTVVTHTTDGDSPPSAATDPITPGVPQAPALPHRRPVADGALLGRGAAAGGPAGAHARVLTVTGSGFAARTPVRIGVYADASELGVVVTDDTGAFTTEVTVPAAGRATRRILVAVGWEPQLVAIRTLTLPVRIPDAPGWRPPAGPLLVTAVLWGLGLAVSAGVGLAALRRRRYPDPDW